MTDQPQSPPVIETANEFRKQLARQEGAASRRLIDAYVRAYNRLAKEVDLLILEIGDNPPTRNQLYKMKRYRSLMSQTVTELAGLQSLTANEIEALGENGIKLGGDAAAKLISSSAVGTAEASAAFNRLPTAAVETLVGFLQPESALYKRLAMLAPTVADNVAAAMVEGLTLGYNSSRIARMFQGAFGNGLTDAIRFIRTAQLYAYREATRATYIANQDIVTGWVWQSALNLRTCMSCLNMHGTVHPLDEPLNDHHNGRCTPIPLLAGRDNPITQSGEQWFNAQPEGVQRQMAGPAKLQSYRDGLFTFDKLTKEYDNDVYGVMRVEASLIDIVGEKKQKEIISSMAGDGWKVH